MIDKLYGVNELQQILLVVNGTNSILDGATKDMLDILHKMFTSKMWENISVVFTKLPMDQKNILKRKRSLSKTDQQFADDYSNKIKEAFEIDQTTKLNTFFIDMYYDDEDRQERDFYRDQLEKLWKSITQKSKISTTSVGKIIESLESLLTLMKNKENALIEQERKVRDLELSDLYRMEENEESRSIDLGYSYYRMKDCAVIDDSIDNYVQHVRKISPHLNHFCGTNALYENSWHQIKDTWTNAPYGLQQKDAVSRKKSLNSYQFQSHASMSFILCIKNTTKYFLNGENFSSGFNIPDLPHCLWDNAGKKLTSLTALSTFVIPPFTQERLVFIKNDHFSKGSLESVLTFCIGNYPLANIVERLMVMFKINTTCANSYAVGFPKRNIDRKESEQIIRSTNKTNLYYSKNSVSRADERVGMSQAGQISWPPEDKKIPGALEVSFSIGNFQHCIGYLSLKKSAIKCVKNTKHDDNIIYL